MTHPLLTRMEGNRAILEPFAPEHVDELRNACDEDPDIWSIYPLNFHGAAFDASFAFVRDQPNWYGFAIVDRASNTVEGFTHFINPDVFGVVEIGATYLAPKARGTGLNSEAKKLMLDRAFATGITKVEFRIDTRNARSMAAVVKLGAVHEGTARQNLVTWTGFRRDTALFGILRDEWVMVRTDSVVFDRTVGSPHNDRGK